MKFFNFFILRKRSLAMVISLLWFGAVSSQNLVNETFSFPLNSTITTNGYTAHSSGGSNAIKVTDTALTFLGYDLSGSGRSITIDTVGEDVNKSFTTVSSGSVYASFLVKVTKSKATGDYFFHFGQSTIGTTFFTKVFAKADAANPGKIAFGVSKANNSSTATYTGFNYYEDSTYLLAVSYSFISGSANDTVTMWVNPTSSSFSTPTLLASDYTVADKANIGTYAFRQGSNSAAPQVQLSSLKIDTLWANLFGAPSPVVATPVFSTASGTFNNDTSVAISCSTPGATIYYSQDGSTPNTSSLVYSSPISLNTSKTIKASAFKSGMDSSNVAVANYSLMVATPSATPIAGTYTTIQNVSLGSATLGSTLYYTLDGTIPDTSSTLYSSPIQIDSSLTLKAIAYKNGYDSSSVFSAAYTINIVNVNAPQISVVGGIYYSNQTVSLSTTTIGASIYYTVDGSNPSSNTLIYSTPISISQSTILKAIAILGADSSLISTEVYVLKVDTVFSNLAAGNYSGVQSVVLTNATVGATIYYSIDGTLPTLSSPQYSAPIQVSNSLTLKAIAMKSGWENSVVSSWNYVIATPPAGFPLVDTFAYGLNNQLTAYGYNAHSGAGFNSIKVSGPSLVYTNYLYSNAGNSILLDTTGEDINKLVGPVTSGAIYTAFLVNVQKATTDGEYFFHLGNDVLSTNFRGKVFIKNSTPGFVQFGVSKASNTAQYSQDYAINATHLIVMKYSLQSGGTNDDSVMLWINPTISSKNNPDVICGDLTGADLMNVGTYAFRQGSATKAARLSLSGFVMDMDWDSIMVGLNPVIQAPTISTNNASNVGIHSATLNGNVISDGYSPILERGFVYSTLSNPDFSNPVIISSGTVGTFSEVLQSLNDNQQYFYRAYAINAIDTSYGSTLTFTTLVDGFAENGNISIEFFPNPVEDILQINGVANSVISIYSIIGKKVYDADLLHESSAINLEFLNAGIYIVNIQNFLGSTSFKIIKR
jgi:AraC-like DNA-binding protein